MKNLSGIERFKSEIEESYNSALLNFKNDIKDEAHSPSRHVFKLPIEAYDIIFHCDYFYIFTENFTFF